MTYNDLFCISQRPGLPAKYFNCVGMTTKGTDALFDDLRTLERRRYLKRATGGSFRVCPWISRLCTARSRGPIASVRELPLVRRYVLVHCTSSRVTVRDTLGIQNSIHALNGNLAVKWPPRVSESSVLLHCIYL